MDPAGRRPAASACALNWAELGFILAETLLFKGIIVPKILFAVIRRTKINRVRTSGSSQAHSLLLSLAALAASASVSYYVADPSVNMVFFGVALYSLLSGLILIVLRSRIFSHMVGFLVIENGVFSSPRLSASRCPCSSTRPSCSTS